MANEDPAYTAWLRTQPCQAPGPHDCRGVEIHHPPHRRATGLGARRAHDHHAVRLCVTSHVHGVHALRGPFKGWTRERVRAWADERAAENRARDFGPAVAEREGFAW